MRYAILIASMFICSCATMPKESLILSEQMGVMIQKTKAAHVELVDSFEKQQIDKIDQAMQTIWIPQMVGEMASHGDLWGKTCKNPNTLDAKMELGDFVQAAARKIAKKRKEFTDQLDADLAVLRAAIDENYSVLMLSNKTITDNIRSVRGNDEVVSDTLKMLESSVPKLSKASDRLDKLLYQ